MRSFFGQRRCLRRRMARKAQLYSLSSVCCLSFIILFLTGYLSNLYAQEEEIHEYVFPVIGPNVDLEAGYSLIDLKGPARTEEYEYLHNSIYLAGEGVYFSFPHRLNLDLEFKNKKDYYSDLSYSYKDLIFFRSISRSLFHNLENLTPNAFDVITGLPSIEVRDAGEIYGIRSGIYSYFLRFKAPDYPFHIYLDGRIVDKEGIKQQTGLIGAGYFNNILVSTRKRVIDWKLEEMVIGTNSHIGPIEIDLSHGESRFNIKGDKIFYDLYSPAGFTSPLLRETGAFPHNLLPEIKGSSNTIKLHTSYTGGLVASATLSKIEKENKDSGAKSDYFIGSGEVMWMPMTRLTFFLKYRHRERDMDIPSSASIVDISNPANSYTYLLKEAISSTSDSLSGIVRYRPVKGLTLRVEYTFENLRRNSADLWGLPSSTERGNLNISADMRLHRTLNIRARYTHKETDNPAYNYEPERADEGRISITWTPLQRVNIFLGYMISKEKRDDIYFKNTNSQGERDVKKDRLTGNLTFLIMNNLSLTTSCSYIHNRTTQDITLLTLPSFTPEKDSMVPYKDLARNYGIDINYEPQNNITLSGGVSHTISRGIFYPSISALTDNESVSNLSELKIRETVYSINGEYRLKRGFSVGLKYRYTSTRDIIDNPNDDISDGKAHIILLTLTKKWK